MRQEIQSLFTTTLDTLISNLFDNYSKYQLFLILSLKIRNYDPILNKCFQRIVENRSSQISDDLLHIVTPSNSKRIDLKNSYLLTNIGVQAAIKRCPSLHTISVDRCPLVGPGALLTKEGLPISNLISISLENLNTLDDSHVQVILAKFSSLKHFSVMGTRSITDNAFSPDSIASHSDTHLQYEDGLPSCSLVSINLSVCHNLTSLSVKYIVQLCGHSLAQVNLSGPKIDCKSLLFLSGRDSKLFDCKVLVENSKSERLFIKTCNTEVSSSGVEASSSVKSPEHSCLYCSLPDVSDTKETSPEQLITADKKSSYESQITKLALSDEAAKSSALYNFFVSTIPVITHLDIVGINFTSVEQGNKVLSEFFSANTTLITFKTSWKYFTDDTLHVLCMNSANLVNVALMDNNFLTDDGVNNLCNTCLSLKVLNLHGASFISDAGIRPAVTRGLLTSLNLAETSVTDETLSTLYNCTMLNELDLSWCDELTANGFDELHWGCQLKSISLRQGSVKNTALSSMIETCPATLELNLSSVAAIDDLILTQMAEKLSRLTNIDIGWNTEVTNLGVSALLRQCLFLKVLILSGIKNITTEPFFPLIVASNPDSPLSFNSSKTKRKYRRSTVYATELQRIDLEYCDFIDDDQISEIVLGCYGTLVVSDYHGQLIEY